MVLEDKYGKMLCEYMQDYPILWDQSREDYKEKDRPKGKRAKESLLSKLKEADPFWTSYDVKTVMSIFRGFKAAYAKSLKPTVQKSGEGREEAEERVSTYKHASYLRYLDGIAVGTFGQKKSVTNLDRELEEDDDSISVQEDQDLAVAGQDLQNELLITGVVDGDEAEQELSIIKKLKSEDLDGNMKPTTSLKATKKSPYTLEREKMRAQNKQLVTGFEKMSAAVVALASSSATSSSSVQVSPKRKRKPAGDQFESFGDMVASRLRSLDDRDATDLMASISGLLFRQNDRFTYLNM